MHMLKQLLKPLPEKTFNRALACGFIASAFAVAAFNYVINPFGLFAVEPIKNISDVRNITNVRLYKNFYVHRHAMQGLILGSSRSEEGLRPQPGYWKTQQVYNMAMPGVSLAEMRRNLMHANATGSVQHVLIGLDFFMFSAFQEHADDFSEDFFAVNERGETKASLYPLRTWINVLFSADGLQKSWQTLQASKHHKYPSHETNGMAAEQPHLAVVKDDEAVLHEFDSFEKSYFKKGGYWLNGPNSTYTFENVHDGTSTLRDYEALLRYCYEHHIQTTLIISPVHARFLLGLQDIGLWPQFIAWKNSVVKINEALAQEYQREPLPLWDFAVVNDYTSEALPDLTQPDVTRKHGMQWFWDPAHYKPALGDAIQQRIFATQQEDLGSRLHGSSLAQQLQQQQAAVEYYRAQDQRAAVEVRAVTEKLQTFHWIQQ